MPMAMGRSKRPPSLAVGGRQVNGKAPRRELKIGISDGRPHTILALLHRRFGKPTMLKLEAGADVDFDSNLRASIPALCSAKYCGDGHPLPLKI